MDLISTVDGLDSYRGLARWRDPFASRSRKADAERGGRQQEAK
jgi:hypothetical protein